MKTGMAILLVARLCLGLFFLTSALGKLTHQRSFVRGTMAYQILPECPARIVGYTLPWIELALSLALIVGFALPITGLLAMLLLLIFIAAVAINLRRGRLIACNCHGIAGTKTISLGTITRNVLLFLLGAALVSLSRDHRLTASLRDDLPAISSGITALVLLLMLSFCVISVLLLEWTVDISSRVSRLTTW